MKQSAGFAILWDGKILLSHHTNASWFGTYSIIKGEIEPEEANLLAIHAALREFKEETGFDLRPVIGKVKVTKNLEDVSNDTIWENEVVQRDKQGRITKTLKYYVWEIESPKEIGIMEGEKYPSANLQHSEIDWAGFVKFEDAKKRMAPYQLPILDVAMSMYNSKFLKERQEQEKPMERTTTASLPAKHSTNLSKIVSDGEKQIPYIPISDICEDNLGTVVPRGMISEMYGALNQVKSMLVREYGMDLDEYVQSRLHYTPEELGIDRALYNKASEDEKRKLINSKLCSAFAGEQMDALALGIFNMERSGDGGYGLIIGDMTGIGKGRVAAGLIRYCIKHLGKTPIFITEKSYLFSDIFRDLQDIKSDPMIPIVLRDPDSDYKKVIKMTKTEMETALNERLEMGESEEEALAAVEEMSEKGFKLILGYKNNPDYLRQEKKIRGVKLKVNPFILNDRKDESKIKDSQGNIIYEPISSKDKQPIFEKGVLPKEYNLVMLTYSQVNSGRLTAKKQFLNNIAKNSVIICDESHAASGQSNTGNFIFNLLKNAHGAAFLSATYSKTPSNMVVYAAKTSLRDAELTQEDLISAITRGGVPLQEIIGSQLVSEGQMVRRERSYEGVDILWNTLDRSMAKQGRPELDLKDRHTAIANMFTEILRQVIDLQHNHIRPWLKELKRPQILAILADLEKSGIEIGPIDIDPHQDTKKMLTSSPTFSRVFNLTNQLLFSIKSEAIADRAIQYMKEGKKPIIAFSNTMGAFLDGMTNEDGSALQSGDEIKTDFRLVLLKLLDTLRRISIKDPKGNAPRRFTFPVSIFPYEIQMAYKAIKTKVERISIGISISPIDVMIARIKEAGFSVEEVTGRQGRVIFGDSYLQGVYDSRQKPTTADTFRAFNENRIDCLLINQSGAVGASIQAKTNEIVTHVKTKQGTVPYVQGLTDILVPNTLEPKNELKQRVMIMLQSELNINTEVQKRGRIFRSGQVLAPMYEYLCSAIPCEQRLQMMMQKKLRSLDANTSADQKGSDELVNIVDFLNREGDEIVVKYLLENAELITKLGFDGEMIDKNGNPCAPKSDIGFAHKATGRAAILSVSDQEKFYNEISSRYTAYIELLKDTDQYTGEVSYLDLQAETINRQIFQVGSGTNSFFGRNTILEKCEVNNLRKPYKRVEIEQFLMQNLSDFYDSEHFSFEEIEEASKEKQREIIREHEIGHKQRLERMDESYADKLKYSLSRLEDDKTYRKLLMTNPEDAQKIIDAQRKSTIAKSEKDKEDDIVLIKNSFETVKNYLEKIRVGMVTNYTVGLLKTRAIVLDVKIDEQKLNPWAPSSIQIKVAVANGVRVINVPLSNSEYINMFISETISNYTIRRNTISDWDDITANSMADRVERYIVTGNLLQAMGDPVIAENNGKLMKFTQIRNGKIFLRNGVLLSQEFDPTKHTAGRSGFILVPAKKCRPLLERLERNFKEGEDGQAIFETNNSIQFSRSDNGRDFLMRMPEIKAGWRHIYTDRGLCKYVADEKGFSNRGTIKTWSAASLQRVDERAMGAIIPAENIDAVLDYLSSEWNLSMRVANAVFQEMQGALGVNAQDDYEDGDLIEEGESGLAQAKLNNVPQNPINEVEKVVEGIGAGLEQPHRPEISIGEPEETPTTSDILDGVLEKEAKMRSEVEKFNYEKKLFELQRMMFKLSTGKMATGGRMGFKIDDIVFNKKFNTLGIVRDTFDHGDHGDVRTDADGVVYAEDLELFDPEKHKGYQLAPSTKMEIKSRNLLEYLQPNERDREIAEAIIQQLGGIRRIRAFTGASLTVVKNGVKLSFPDGPYKKADYFKVVLNGQDTYDISWGKEGEKEELNGIYDDQLVEIFEDKTGLYLHFEQGGAMDTPEYRALDEQYKALIAKAKVAPRSGSLQSQIKSVQDKKKRLVFGEGVKLETGGDLTAYWNEKLQKAYVGKVIAGYHFLSQQEAANVGWDDNGQDSCLVIQFTDGTLCFPSQDDEGNGPGFLWISDARLPSRHHPGILPIGGVITEAAYVSDEFSDDNHCCIQLEVTYANRSRGLDIRVWQDPEGNGPGALFGQGIEDFPVL